MNAANLNSETRRRFTRLTGKALFIALFVAGLGVWNGEALAITKTFNVNSGSWATAGSWTPSGVPAAADDVVFPATVTSVTGVPDGSINSVTILGTSGTINLQGAASGNTLTIVSEFSLLQGRTLTIGNTSRLNLVFSTTCTSTIAGTLTIYSGTTNRSVTNNGDLTITATGLINQNGGSDFILGAGATLQIGNTNGIVAAGTNSGAIQTEVRTFSPAAHYVYNGTASQNTGTGYPTALTGSLTIDNPNTVTLPAAARTITTGTLNLVQGTFATNNGGNRLSLGNNATVNRSGGSMTGTLQGTNSYDVNFTGNSKTAGPELLNAGLRHVTVNLSTGQTLTSATNAFSTTGNLNIQQGTIHLQATNANYNIAGNLAVASGAILKHSQDWNSSGTQIILNGSLDIGGAYDYSSVGRAHIGMYGAGNKTISAPNTDLSILTLNDGNFSATGNFTVNDNFWAMFGTTTGIFNTNGQVVTALSALLVNGGQVNINGGTLNISGGFNIGYQGNNGACVFSSGTLNTDMLNLGSGTYNGTFTHSGGTANIGLDLIIASGSSYTCTGSQAINLGRNFTRTGTFTAATSTLTLNGTAGQTIGGAAGTTFYNVAITNTTNPVVFGAAHSFSNNLSIATNSVANLSTFTHTAGTLTMGGTGRTNGSWGHPNSTATYKNNVYFAANTGIINVSTGTCTAPAMAVQKSDVSCFAGNDGSITVTVTGGVADYEFSKDGGSTWTSPQASNQYTFSNLTVAGGPYSIAVRDGSGCVQTVCQ